MRALTAAALVLVFLPPTLQRCHSEQVLEDCEERYDYNYRDIRRFCTEYYEMHCYEVTNELESAHMESVHKIIVKSGDMKSLTRSLFAGFNNVRSITMTGSDIASIEPNTFANLQYLKSVNLTGNVLEVLSQGSFNSGSLETLDLSNNNINAIQHNTFTNVTKLMLRHNQITNISNLVATCSTLETLDLSYNNINTIELSEKCASLSSLNAAHNEVSKFRVTSNRALVINILDLSCNRLHDISRTCLYNLDTLSSLSLNNNPLFYAKNPAVDLFQNTLRLQLLNLSATGIQEIYVGTFNKLSSLKQLDLSQNNLTILPKGIFHDLESLEQLYLNDNRLKYFDYEGFRKLTRIDLNANLFTCDTLVDIVNTLNQKNPNIIIINGNTYGTRNIVGVNCLDTIEEAKTITNQFEHSADHQDKEHYKFFNKVEQIVQQLLLEQENTSLILSGQQNKSYIYWGNITQDYQHFLQTLQQRIGDTLQKITNAFTTSTNTNTIKINELEVGNFSLQQWKLLQRNFTETLKLDRSDFLGAMRSSFMLLSNYNENITAVNGSNKILIIGTYGIFLVLLVGLVLSLLSKWRSCRCTKIKHEECNPLSGMPV